MQKSMAFLENAEKFHCLECKGPGGDLKESRVSKGSMRSAFSCVHGEPEEVLNQEDDIRSVLERMLLAAVGGWIGQSLK